MKDKEWTFVITPRRKWFDINLKEYWQYRDLYFMYIRRDLIAAYTQTILGPLWYLIQPLFTMVIYMFIFGDLAGIPTDGVPEQLFYFSGIMLWSYFSSSFSITAAVLSANVAIYSKVYFPRLIIPAAAVTGNLVKLGIQIVLFAVLYLWFALHGSAISVNWVMCLAPFLILLLALHAMSWGLVMATITYKYRDLKEIINFGLQLFMYVTPVVYPLSATPPAFRTLIELNPLSPIFEFFRYGAMSCGSIQWWDLWYSVGFLAVVSVISLSLFSRTEKNFMDTV